MQYERNVNKQSMKKRLRMRKNDELKVLRIKSNCENQ